MNSKPFKTPFPDAYKKVEDAVWEYYLLCFPDLDEGDRYDLTRGPLVEIEDTVRRLYKRKDS